MRLAQLEVLAFPGVESPFRIDAFKPGVNLLLGPNASGKSRVAQAIRSVLDPTASRGEEVSVVAVFEFDGRQWRASRIGDTVRWERDGVASDPPRLPEGHLLDGLFLELEDLHRFGGSDRAIATRLATELAGGVDLAAARDALQVVGPRNGRAQAKALTAARDERREAERRRDGLAAEQARRDELAGRQAAAAARAASASRLRTTRDAIAHRRQRRALATEGDRFPSGLERLHGRAREEADGWEAAVREAWNTVEGWRETLGQEAAAVRATGLDTDHPRARQAEQLRLLADRLADAERELESAERTLSETLRAGGDDDEAQDPPAGPTVRELDELETLAAARDEARAEVASLKRRLALAESGGHASLAEATLAGAAREAEEEARALAAWLGLPRPEARIRTTVRVGALLGAAGASGMAAWRATDGAVLASGEATGWLAGAALFVAVALGSELFGLRLVSERRRLERTIEGLRTRSGDLEVDGAPTGWTREEVSSALLNAVRRAADAAHMRDVQRDAAARAQELRAELVTAEQHEAKLAGSVSARAAEAGLDPSMAERPWLERSRRASERREAWRASQRARARRDDHAKRLSDLKSEIEQRWQEARGVGQLSGRLGEDSDGPWQADTVRLAAQELAELIARRDRALEKQADAERRLGLAREAAVRAERRRNEGLAALLGWEPEVVAEAPAEALAELRARLELRPAWESWRDEVTRVNTLLEHAVQALASYPELLATVESEDEEGVVESLAAAEAAEKDRDAATSRLAALDERIAQARHDRTVETARLRERQAYDELERALEASLDGEAAAFVLGRIEGAYHSERRPAALQRAEAWFERFTHHAFALRFDPAGPDGDLVRAVDRLSGRERRLSELSSATRAQLLLALRVSSALEAEAGGPPLPMVLDEALTTSDVGRFAAVAEALSELVRDDGRQILYLSARRDDARLWRQLAEREGAEVVVPTVLDLPRLRGRSDAWDPSSPAGTELAPAPPAPGADTPERYGTRLGVAAVDPWRADAIHPFHLLCDRLDLVHRLARWRIAGLGPLEALLQDPSATPAIVTEEERELLAARVAGARAWAQAWRIGRGRPVDRSALAASGAVSERFLPRVAALAVEHAGDARALLNALEQGEVKFFRDDARIALAAWLEENDYLDPRPRLGAGELRLAAGVAMEERRRAASIAPNDPLDGVTLAGQLERGMRMGASSVPEETASGVLFDSDSGDA